MLKNFGETTLSTILRKNNQAYIPFAGYGERENQHTDGRYLLCREADGTGNVKLECRATMEVMADTPTEP